MAAQDYYDTNIPTQEIDVSASTRKFQTSIIVTQDSQKSGYFFLKEAEEVIAPTPTQPAPQTIRPTSGGAIMARVVDSENVVNSLEKHRIA